MESGVGGITVIIVIEAVVSSEWRSGDGLTDAEEEGRSKGTLSGVSPALVMCESESCE